MLGKSDGSVSEAAISFYDTYLFKLSQIIDLAVGKFIGKNVMISAVKPA
jgi:hypothetical protein